LTDIFRAILLGIVEGLTEFLPVSSTAHIRIAQDLMHIDRHDAFWKMFAVVIQLGAVLCLPIYFRKRIVDLIRTFPRGASGTGTAMTHPLSLVVLATVVTVGPCYLMDKKIGEQLENMWVIGGSLLVFGVVMWVVDVLFTRPTTPDLNAMSWRQAICIGAAQIVAAAFPGTSRSMSTIAAGQIVGLSRPAALEFSFFLSMPIMFAASGLKLSQAIFKKTPEGHVDMTADRWLVLAVGFIVSFIVALVVVHWFMGWVRRRGFAPFAIYRIIVGALVLIFLTGNRP